MASMPGLQHVLRECPGLEVYVAAVDQELDAKGYINPGLGAYGAGFRSIATDGDVWVS